MDEEERRALAALAARVGRGEDEEEPPPRGLAGRLRAVWNAKDVGQLKRAVGLAAAGEEKDEAPPWPPVGTYIEAEAADELRAAAAAVGKAPEEDRPAPAPQAPPSRSELMAELGRAAASVGRAEEAPPRRRRPVVEPLPATEGEAEEGEEPVEEVEPGEPDEQEAAPRPALSDGEKAFCIVSPLPWIGDVAAKLYLAGGAADADTASLILIGSVGLSYLMTGLGGLLIFFARRQGRPLLGLWAATLVAASLFLWWLFSSLVLVFARSSLVALGWL